METDRLVDEYLARLDAAAAHMQRARRTELVAEIREHIETALREEEAASEAAVRNVLERLGPPEEIVEAAEPVSSAADGHGRAGKLEVAALILLVVPLVGWIVGVVLVVVSRAWSNREKLIGVALALLPALVPLLVLTAGAESGGTVSAPGRGRAGVKWRRRPRAVGDRLAGGGRRRRPAECGVPRHAAPPASGHRGRVR